MRTIEMQVYKFNELSDKVKRKLISVEQENNDYDHLWQQFKTCLFEFVNLFGIENKQIDYEVDPYGYSYITFKVENRLFKNINKRFINTIDDDLTGICYGIDMVATIKEEFKISASVKNSIQISIDKALYSFISEVTALNDDDYIIEELINMDHDYLIDGRKV